MSLQKQTAEAGTAKAVLAEAVTDGLAPTVRALSETVEGLRAALAALQAKSTESLEEARASKSTDYMGGRISGGESVPVDKGIRFARVLKASLAARLKGARVDDVEAVRAQLRGWGYDEEAHVLARVAESKAMTQNVFAEGGALVPTQYSSEVVAILRNTTVVRRLGARIVPMGASMEMPTQDQAATAGYVGEGQNIIASDLKFGSIRLAEKKLASLVVISNDMIRNAVISAEEWVRDELVNVIALKEDQTALFGVGSEYTPRGIESLTVAANKYAATATSATAPTLAEVKKELAKAKRRLKAGNIPMVRLGWIASPRTEEYLYSITDGNGNSVFQAALDSGTLHGAPFYVTNQIPENGGGTTDEAKLFFGDWNQFLIGESMGLAVEVFPNASYDLSGTVQSGISKDQSVVRGISKHDFNTRYSGAFVVVTLRWGA